MSDSCFDAYGEVLSAGFEEVHMSGTEQVADDIRCAYETADDTRPASQERLTAMFEEEAVSGRRVSSRFLDLIFGQYRATKLYLIMPVHVVAQSSFEPKEPIVSDDYVDEMIGVAQNIWSQACIELVPYSTGSLVTTFRDIGLLAQYGVCLDSDDRHLIEPYNIQAEGTTIVNIYVVGETGGIACGSPVTGHVFVPATGRSAQLLGKVLAHELGHIMLNAAGVDDSDNPDHLMFHAYRHPDVPRGSESGLFLSDCLAARTTARENLFVFGHPGGFGGLDGSGSPDPVSCLMAPRLGSNLDIVVRDPSVKL